MDRRSAWVVLGGSGFVGSALRAEFAARGAAVTVVDMAEPHLLPGERWLPVDLRTGHVDLPEGHVVLAFGQSMPRPVRPWTLVMDNALVTARLAPALEGRTVTLLSSVETYGSAPGPLRETTDPRLPVAGDVLDGWVDRALARGAEPITPHGVMGLCTELASWDPSGRWIYALSKLAQERIVQRNTTDAVTVLRLANVVGTGQFRLLGRLVEAVLAGRPCAVTDTVRSFVSVEDVARIVAATPGPGTFNVSAGTLRLADVATEVAGELGCRALIELRSAHEDDSCGQVDATALRSTCDSLEDIVGVVRRAARALASAPPPMFPVPLAVVLPPRPEHPDVVADRCADALWTGRLRHAEWSTRLHEGLASHLHLVDERRLVLTNSGTNALRLAVTALAGRPGPGQIALCPAYTFHATAEVLHQLGWRVRLVDVDPWTWTIDPDLVAEELSDPAVRLVVAVDALGNPADYGRLVPLCREAGVPLVADSAPAIGAVSQGDPVGVQADAHAFSMSFAKTLSGGGSGGAVVLPHAGVSAGAANWARSSPMAETSAIAALDQLEVLDTLIERRTEIADIYRRELLSRPGFCGQHVRAGDEHALVHWVMRVPNGMSSLARALAREGVGTKGYYEPLADVPDRPIPVTTTLHRQALALPMSSEMSVDEAERVAYAVARVLRRTASPRTEDLVAAAPAR